ncbi:cytochrome p450 [Trichoderma arundinaceum]|uniref:Cytochrome p450 n=1 Tax=Trichoderma arundinaceum TaxID=490622 RepID=A0A395NF68_TRIAR|nr:cytochrome p450 [Trichoderma arundinaceum]
MSIPTSLLWACILLLGVVSVKQWHSLFRNYVAARKIGIRFHVIPVNHTNYLWMLIGKSVVHYFRRIFGESTFTRYNWLGWELHDRYYSHHELGDVFMLATPGRNWLYVGHPDIAMDIVRRRDDFPRCVELTQILDVFGPSVGSVEGQQWAQQRKLMASCFNEKYNEVVWAESISQAGDMIHYWLSRPSVQSTADDLRALSLGVLAKAGFGKSFKFEGHEETSPSNPAASYKDSLQLILENCVLLIAMGPKFFTNMPWLPFKWRQLGEAVSAFQKSMTDMYESEKRKLAESETGDSVRRTFLSSLAKASLDAKDGEGLTEREIYGNIFVINFAGHDTVSHVFTFAVYFLASNPEVQDWLSEELHHVLGDKPPHEWNYTTDFPRLKRCLAVLYESMRLYTPVPVTKWTQDKAQHLNVGNKTILIPPNTMVCLAYSSLQTDPRWWGSDSLTWRPSRFISNAVGSDDKSSVAQREAADLDAEQFLQPRRGTFIGWSEGTRDCPGRKFSQVEFVATMASIFRDWRVDPARFQGETVEGARERVLRLIETESGMVLLVQMLHPEKAPLVWSRRKM